MKGNVKAQQVTNGAWMRCKLIGLLVSIGGRIPTPIILLTTLKARLHENVSKKQSTTKASMTVNGYMYTKTGG